MASEKVDPPDALVRGLVQECEELKKGLVIGCDANAHHTQWGCPINNDREAQHAYTKGKSTESALHLVVSNIEKSLSIQEYTLIAFLDIEGAFNNVLPTAITESLTELGVEPPLVGLIHKLLISRLVTATLGTSTQTRLVNRGTPQGGVLSPLLWNIAVNKLLRILEGGGCKIVAYADDVAIIFNGRYPQTLCDLMTAKLKTLSEWTTKNGLGVNPSKTELVLFTNRYKIPKLNPPTLNNCNLSFSEHARYLGLVLDKRLKWGLNNQERTKKATIALYSCKKAIGLRWGMSPKIVNWIYIAVVKPILLYGVALWWTALHKQCILTPLNKVQRMAALCMSGALRTTPNEALNAILNLQSLDLAGMERAKSAAIRLRDTGQWKAQLYGHAKILQHDKLIPPKTDLCKTREYNHTPFEALIPGREVWDRGRPGSIDAICLYTDGSKLDGHVGGGIYSEQLEIRRSFRLPDHCSVFQAEVYAIMEALVCLRELNTQNRHINIYSDSQAAIKSIYSTNTNSRTIADCRKSLHEMANQFTVSLIWVPGHRDIVGNCIADELARQGTTIPLLPGKENVGMPMATCKLIIKNHFSKLANTYWQNTPQCRISHQTWPVINNKKTSELLNFSRTECSMLIRVLTGHWLVGAHAGRLKAPKNDFCRSCRDEEEEETVEHLLCSCPALCRLRLKHLGYPFINDLTEISQTNLKSLSSFIKSSGWGTC
ncbi:uncharacterized protein LOC123038043 [Drosophila rhopaloa]|uniref:Retrovirus-related Pol polyprotein from type-1 retrotransposable element R1 n=1 Tax=Drosophila rhopaloa TaxID=1041015 RepID=A0ABM5JF34_DRORH|nr:uncharacterized protein LOC123038043 [Drosophila rhopaloa]